jgi:hypothetical protein
MRKSLLCFLIWFVLYKDFLYLCMRVQSRERAETWTEGMRRDSLYLYTIARIRQWTLTGARKDIIVMHILFVI